MPGSVSIDSVTTGDAGPTSAPHKISDKAGKETVTVAFTPEIDGLYPGDLLPGDMEPDQLADVIAYRFRDGGTDQNTGTDVSHKGAICGDGMVCGEDEVSDWSSPQGDQLTEEITYSETGGGADGNRTINLWVLFDNQGWWS